MNVFPAYALLLLGAMTFPACRKSPVAFVEAGEFDVPIGSDEGARECRVFESGGALYISYYHLGDTSLVVRSFPSGGTIRRYDLSAVHDGSEGYYATMSYHIHTPDSVFILPVNLNRVFLVDSLSRIVNSWNITLPFAVEGYEYALVSSEKIPMVYRDGILHILSVRLDVSLGKDAADRQKYYTSVPDLGVELYSNGYLIKYACGAWPDIYRAGRYYNDTWPFRTINPEGQLVYGTGVAPELSLYRNGRLIKTIRAPSRHIDHINPYPEDSIGHFDYWRRYEISEPRYKSIHYDRYRRLYYRIVSHRIDVVGADGLLNSHLDKPWSVIVLDENLRVLDEIMFDEKKYFMYSLDVIPEGLLLLKRERNPGARSVAYKLLKVEVN